MGTSPYNLIYGTNTIMPLELEIPSLCVSFHGIIDKDTFWEQHLQELEMLDEQ